MLRPAFWETLVHSWLVGRFEHEVTSSEIDEKGDFKKM